MYLLLKKTLKKFGVDATIGFTLLTRLIQAFGGVGSIVFIAKYLSAREQGYYYTFVSILAVQVFFELGLTGIITQYTAHEFSNLHWEDKDLSGAVSNQSRLSSLLRFCVKWFGIISVLLFFVLLFSGSFFFSKFGNDSTVNWQLPLMFLCLATSLNLFIDPILAFYDGLGEIEDISKVRLVQKTLNMILLIVLFVTGFKLYSAPIASLLSTLVVYVLIFLTKRFYILKKVWAAKNIWTISYYQEIFPYQWRIALSWISGFFIFQLFNPVLFATEGAKVAGQMGMTLQALNGISGLSMSWISTKIPVFSNYIAKKDFISLDTLFNSTLKNLLVVNGILLVLLNVFIVGLKFYELAIAERFLPLLPTLILSLVCFFNQLVFSWAVYLRCHKKEPFLWQSIVMSILVSASTFVFGKKYGLMGIVDGYAFFSIAVSLTWSFKLFTSKKAKWHNI